MASVRALLIVAVAGLTLRCAPPKPSLRHPDAKRITRQAPALFRVRIETTKGPMLVEAHRAWAPHGADRFFNLVRGGYYDDTRFFRVVKGQWAQFGINGDPAIAALWRERTIPDDPPKAVEPPRAGRVRVRGAERPDDADLHQPARQLRISTRKASRRLAKWSAAWTPPTRSAAEYGERSGGGIRAGGQQPLFDGGNAYLDREYPRLDRLLRAVILAR